MVYGVGGEVWYIKAQSEFCQTLSGLLFNVYSGPGLAGFCFAEITAILYKLVLIPRSI